jgi:hypothetical protein
MAMVQIDFTHDKFNIYKTCKWVRIYEKVKVKVTLEQAMKAQRGSRGIALLFL